jgi:hypothetical protein
MPSVTISQFRKDLFTLVESAASGEAVEFIHKGMRFRLIRPDQPPVDKLSRITPLAVDIVVGSPSEFEGAHRKMSEKIMKDWETGWNPAKRTRKRAHK